MVSRHTASLKASTVCLTPASQVSRVSDPASATSSCRHQADASLPDAQAQGARRGVFLEPISGFHDQEHHAHALALTQGDGVALASLPSPLLHQTPYLGPQIEPLQRAV